MAIVFLKLGGSLITDKHTPSTARPEVLARLVKEIAQACAEIPDLQLVLGHGSGSFGHVAASKYHTRQGVHSAEEWQGFSEVWQQASTLNKLVMQALHAAHLPAVAFPASAGALVSDGEVSQWDLSGLKMSLENGLLPVVYGDVVFDTVRGGTILSTEDIFRHLAGELHPAKILLAGIEAGVWADYPACTQLVKAITPQNLEEIVGGVKGSAATDVTGGMRSKVEEMLALIAQPLELEILIFSGQESGAVYRALSGEQIGTWLHGDAI